MLQPRFEGVILKVRLLHSRGSRVSILKPTRVESQDGTAVPRVEMLQVRSASANKGRGLDLRMQTQGIAKR